MTRINFEYKKDNNWFIPNVIQKNIKRTANAKSFCSYQAVEKGADRKYIKTKTAGSKL